MKKQVIVLLLALCLTVPAALFAQQQAQDHYECHTWAVGQSGFDPAMAQYAPPQQAVDAYRGALSACLGGRGYSIN